MTVLPGTPLFFTMNACEFDYQPEAPAPKRWLEFLDQVFSDDLQARQLLQEWCGYCLTGDTSLQKMLLMVGPRRSGKGTIARVLKGLVGDGNVCGPTATGLAGPFGLQPLLGKSLAVVSDARFSGRGTATVVERLLCISGEDTITIDRKNISAVSVKLSTRFMFLTNELPRLAETSGALAGRFVMLRLTESFYGREDRHLTETLLGELPGIFNWAIQGWQRLQQRGHFEQPASVEDDLRQLEDLASPVAAFVRARCEVRVGLRIDVRRLYDAWRGYCEDEGYEHISTRQTFGRDLIAALPGIRCRCGTGGSRFYDGVDLSRGV